MSNQISYNYYVYDKDGNKIILTQEVYEISESNNDDFRLDPIPETDASSIHFDDKPIGTLGGLKWFEEMRNHLVWRERKHRWK